MAHGNFNRGLTTIEIPCCPQTTVDCMQDIISDERQVNKTTTMARKMEMITWLGLGLTVFTLSGAYPEAPVDESRSQVEVLNSKTSIADTDVRVFIKTSTSAGH
jgi:hypothetical protein